MDIYGFNAPHLPVELLTTLATSEPRLWMYGSDLAHGAFRLVHLLGVSAFIGSIVTLNLKQLGCFPSADIGPMRRPMLGILEVSFWVTVASGLLLFLYDPIATGLHTMFLPKLLLIVAGFVVAKWPRSAPHPPVRRAFAASSLAIWVLVMGCSTWNRIEHPRNPGDLPNLDDGREARQD